MARKIRDAKLESRSARLRLPVRKSPILDQRLLEEFIFYTAETKAAERG